MGDESYDSVMAKDYIFLRAQLRAVAIRLLEVDSVVPDALLPLHLGGDDTKDTAIRQGADRNRCIGIHYSTLQC